MPHTTDVWGSEKLQEVTATYLTYRFGNTSVCRTSAMYVRKSEGPSFLLPMVVAESWGGGGGGGLRVFSLWSCLCGLGTASLPLCITDPNWSHKCWPPERWHGPLQSFQGLTEPVPKERGNHRNRIINVTLSDYH